MVTNDNDENLDLFHEIIVGNSEAIMCSQCYNAKNLYKRPKSLRKSLNFNKSVLTISYIVILSSNSVNNRFSHLSLQYSDMKDSSSV